MNHLNLLNTRVASAFYGKFASIKQSQMAVIEPLMNGKNILLTSGTGSGKTEAVVAPLISRYWIEAITTDKLLILYVAPTKALVNDLEKRLIQPLSLLGLRVGIRHGDRDDLTRATKPHVLITTPESLDVLIFRKEKALNSVKAVVLDEVHLLYNTQRGLQLSILLHRLQNIIGGEIQWAALSATIGNTSHIRDFLMGTAIQAEVFSFPAERNIDCQIRHIHNLSDFRNLIIRLIDGQKLLIFADSRKECERLASCLNQDTLLSQKLFVHYSSLSQQARIDTEERFSSLSSAICIATSTLELGIDIGDIDAVLIWGVPNGVESFLQRIGRGNRRSTKNNVICLIPDASKNVFLDFLKFYVLVDSAMRGEIPIKEPYELYGAIVQQCLSVIASDEGKFIRIADLCELVNYITYIDRPKMETLLSELAQNEMILRHDYKYRYAAYEKLFKLIDMRMVYGNYGIGSKHVQLFHGAKSLGEVPEINLLRVQNGNIVRFQGKYWKVRKTSLDGIILEPTENKTNVIDFAYAGSKMNLDPFIINRVFNLLSSDCSYVDIIEPKLRDKVVSLQETAKKTFVANTIPYVKNIGGIRYFTFGGSLINRAIALFLGMHVFTADDIALEVNSPINWESIPEHPIDYEDIFHQLFDSTSTQSIFQMQLPGNLQEQEYLQSWLKDASINEILMRLKNSKPVEISKELAVKLCLDVN